MTCTRRPTWQPVPYPTSPTHAFQSSHQHRPHLAHQPNHSPPILALSSDSYDCLPSTLRQLLLHLSDKLVFAREPVRRGTKSVDLLMKNLQNHRVPNTLTFKENAIIWYRSLLLNQAHTDDMTGFNTGILIAYGMCPPVELAQYYQMDPATQPTHFMQGTHTEVWGDDMFEVMHRTAADWDSNDNDDSP